MGSVFYTRGTGEGDSWLDKIEPQVARKFKSYLPSLPYRISRNHKRPKTPMSAINIDSRRFKKSEYFYDSAFKNACELSSRAYHLRKELDYIN